MSIENKLRLMEIFDKTIETTRLRLRRLELSDASDMYEYTSNSSATIFLHWDAHVDISQTINFITKEINSYGIDNSFIYGIELKECKKLIGVIRVFDVSFVNFSCELSYILNPLFQNKGFMFEALNKIIEFLFNEIMLIRVQARCSIDNLSSIGVINKIGLKKEGVLRKFWNIKGTQKDVVIFSILSDEFNYNL